MRFKTSEPWLKELRERKRLLCNRRSRKIETGKKSKEEREGRRGRAGWAFNEMYINYAFLG